MAPRGGERGRGLLPAGVHPGEHEKVGGALGVGRIEAVRRGDVQRQLGLRERDRTQQGDGCVRAAAAATRLLTPPNRVTCSTASRASPSAVAAG
nr:hypothetical protein GCM10020092_004210 [Actinoplanes digitatis]